MTLVNLATEDELSERLGTRLIGETGLEVGLKLRQGGYGYLRRRIGNFCAMARQSPMLVLTDLDKAPCPSALISKWIGEQEVPPSLMLRVAVREIEAWLLADRDGFAAWLRISVHKLPQDPDQVEDPKQRLLQLAARAPRDIRSDLLPRPGAAARQGLGYNERLGEFISIHWSSDRAAERSESLRRARLRLRRLAADKRS